MTEKILPYTFIGSDQKPRTVNINVRNGFLLENASEEQRILNLVSTVNQCLEIVKKYETKDTITMDEVELNSLANILAIRDISHSKLAIALRQPEKEHFDWVMIPPITGSFTLPGGVAIREMNGSRNKAFPNIVHIALRGNDGLTRVYIIDHDLKYRQGTAVAYDWKEINAKIIAEIEGGEYKLLSQTEILNIFDDAGCHLKAQLALA